MNHLLLSALLVTALAAPASAKPILTYEELDEDGNRTPVTDEQVAVDINSTLLIKLNKDELRRRLAGTGDAELTAMLEELTLLSNSVAEGQQAMQPLTAALQTFHTTRNNASLTQVRTAKSAVAKALNPILDKALEEPTPGQPAHLQFRSLLRAQVDAVKGQDTLQQAQAVFDAATARIQQLRAELDRKLQQGGTYFQLGAWLQTSESLRPVHVPGFDVYPEQEPYVVERWRFALTEDQKKQLQQVNTLANQINGSGIGSVARELGPAMLRQLAQSTVEPLTQLSAQLTALNGLATDATTVRDETVRAITDYTDLLKVLSARYSTQATGSSTDLLLQTDRDLTTLVERTQQLISTLERADTKLLTLSNDIKTAITGLKSSVLDVANSLRGLTSVARANSASLEFGKEVLQLDIGNLPDEATLRLQTMGRRAPTDLLIIRFAMGQGTEPNKRQEPVNRTFSLARVLPHFDTAVSLIFASPLGGKAQFQAAASYSVLLKWGSRESVTYNNLVDVGLGLNLAAINMNQQDPAPELGIGLTLSLFRNILQGGIGYDVFTNQWYGFFGVSLPLPTIGGIPTFTGVGTAGAP